MHLSLPFQYMATESGEGDRQKYGSQSYVPYDPYPKIRVSE